jgi:NADH-quinone oxidoreductase subunit J
MFAEIVSVAFYVFALTLVASALAVISARNPVHAVFFLILAFFNAAALFVLLGAEYIAMTLVIVYVGAVAVLFLFVVMMLNINTEKMREGLMRYLPLGLLVALILLVEIIFLLLVSLEGSGKMLASAAPLPLADITHNAQAIGLVLYTKYALLFQLAGLVLLVAMIGAIVLTFRRRPGVRRQSVVTQLSRTRAESIEMKTLKPGQGA